MKASIFVLFIYVYEAHLDIASISRTFKMSLNYFKAVKNLQNLGITQIHINIHF